MINTTHGTRVENMHNLVSLSRGLHRFRSRNAPVFATLGPRPYGFVARHAIFAKVMPSLFALLRDVECSHHT